MADPVPVVEVFRGFPGWVRVHGTHGWQALEMSERDARALAKVLPAELRFNDRGPGDDVA